MADQTAKYKYKRNLVLTPKEGEEFEVLLKKECVENASQYIKKKLEELRMVVNKNGKEINFEAAVNMMDDELRERLHSEGFENNQEFFTAFEKAYEEKYNEEWELSKINPVW